MSIQSFRVLVNKVTIILCYCCSSIVSASPCHVSIPCSISTYIKLFMCLCLDVEHEVKYTKRVNSRNRGSGLGKSRWDSTGWKLEIKIFSSRLFIDDLIYNFSKELECIFSLLKSNELECILNCFFHNNSIPRLCM